MMIRTVVWNESDIHHSSYLRYGVKQKVKNEMHYCGEMRYGKRESVF